MQTRLSALIEKATEDQSAIEKIRIDGNNLIRSLQNEAVTAEGLLSNIHNKFISHKDKIAVNLTELENSFNKQASNMAGEFDRLKEAFESQIKVNSAYQYWKSKETSHKATASTVLTTIKIYAGFSAFFALIIAGIMSHSTVSQVSIGGLMFVSMSVLGIVWGGRILARLFLSQIGLAEDASERATLVKTFIALVREGGAKDEQMDIVLNALCRSASKGLGNDEGSPVLPIEAIVKKVAGR
jgi:hypothetical protein